MAAPAPVRVLITPCDAHSPGGLPLALSAFSRHFLRLRHPVSGTPACYVVAPDGRLQELHWSKQRHTAWFIDNSVSADGSLYLATPKGDDMGRFRSLDDIVSVDGYPGYECLLPYLQRSLGIICESRDVEEAKFYRLDDSKVVAWLLCKVTRLSEALKTSSSLFHGLHPNELNLYVVKMLGECLKGDPWVSLICKHMGVDTDALKSARGSFTPSMSVPSRTVENKRNKLDGPAAKKGSFIQEQQTIRSFIKDH